MKRNMKTMSGWNMETNINVSGSSKKLQLSVIEERLTEEEELEEGSR